MRLRPAYTPRDRLDQLLDYVRRAARYWWLALGLTVAGGLLTAFYASKKEPVYASQAVLVYQPRIQSVVLAGRDAETVQRNIGDRYRELLLSRKNLAAIITDPSISPFPDAVKTDHVDEAVEDLRSAVAFDSRGANTFRITYNDVDRKRAQKIAARLTQLLIDAETDLRQSAARATVEFAKNQKKAADDELKKRETEYSQFLQKHPEFAQEDITGGGEGAAIRAQQKVKNAPAATGGNPRLLALQRQADRLRAILAAPDGAAPPPPTPTPHVKTPAQVAAQQAIDDAQREVNAAQRRLDDARARFTDRHPDVIKAQGDLADAKARLQAATAAMPPDADEPPDLVPSTGPIDRDKLARDLAELEKQIDAEKARTTQGAPTPAADDAKADAIVGLETEHKELKRSLDEQREAVQSLADSVFRAGMAANQQMAENNADLAVVDPAFEPLTPHGKGKRFLVMVGVVIFAGLGAALALGLAILDDRLYRRGDVDKLDLAPVLAVIPKAPRARRRR